MHRGAGGHALAAVSVAALLLAGCTGGKGKQSSTSRPARGPSQVAAASVARTGASAVGSKQKITISATAFTPVERAGLAHSVGPGATVYVGQPVELTTAEPVPAGGVRLTRTYATAVPAGLDATFAYWDTAWQAWHAVPSSLAGDRRSVVAVVHHLSTWTDLVGAVTGTVGDAAHAVQDFASGAADWAYYEVGKVFDTRVEAPTCSANPAWVSAATFIASARNNSLLFCTGHDPNHPDLLEVKARVNRGFAFAAAVGSDSSWQWNSTSATSPLADARNTLGHLDDALSRTFDALSPSGQVLVGAGKELDLGFAEDQVRNAGTGPAVLSFAPPTVVRFMLSLVGQLVGDILSDVQQGYTAAGIIMAGCYDDLHNAHDLGSILRAAKTCLGGLDERVAGLLGSYLAKKKHLSPIESGKLAGKIVARVTVYLALVGPAFSTMNFIAEQTLPASARTVTVFAKVKSAERTRVVNLAPVTESGEAAPGWNIDDTALGYGPLGCAQFGQAYSSPAAITGNIYFCGTTADNTNACWLAASPSQVLCLRDPFTRKLIRRELAADDQPGPVSPVARPQPLGMTLADGNHCFIRTGGAVDRSSEHPDWAFDYYCDKSAAIWGPASLSRTAGIDQSSTTWSVWIGNPAERLHKVAVTTAFYVTTAR